MRALVFLLLVLPELCAAQEAPTFGAARSPNLTPDGHIPLRNVDVLSDTHGLDLTHYLRVNTHLIYQDWRKRTTTDAIGSSHALSEVAVEFTVSRDGSLSGAKLSQPSGDSVLDKAALEAINHASPFEGLPSDYAGQTLELRMRLHYDPERVAHLPQPPIVVPEHARPPVPQVIYNPAPEFSEEARRKGVEGVVTLRLTVSESGDVTDAVVIQGAGYGLDEKALEAVRRWKFKPPLKDGQPISSTITVETAFHLYSGKK